jgi:hypothetical protein
LQPEDFAVTEEKKNQMAKTSPRRLREGTDIEIRSDLKVSSYTSAWWTKSARFWMAHVRRSKRQSKAYSNSPPVAPLANGVQERPETPHHLCGLTTDFFDFETETVKNMRLYKWGLRRASSSR